MHYCQLSKEDTWPVIYRRALQQRKTISRQLLIVAGSFPGQSLRDLADTVALGQGSIRHLPVTFQTFKQCSIFKRSSSMLLAAGFPHESRWFLQVL